MSSRIIVKNIPKHITEKQLQDHFSKTGIITDAKIMRKTNGQSRNFAFLGYKNDSEAVNAIKYFNGTFLWTSKIIVEDAKVQNDPNLNTPWKKNKLENSNKIKSNKISENENGENLKAKSFDENSKENKIKKILELAKQLSTKSKFDAINEQMQKEVEVNGNNTDENNTNDNPDMEKGKNKKSDANNDVDKNMKNNSIKENKDGDAKKYNLEQNKLDPKRLYLKNLPFQTTEEEIKSLFEKYGEITEIHIPKNYKTNQSFGYAYISFATVESCTLAVGELDEKFFQGRKLHISIAEKKQEKEQNNINDKNNINPSNKSDYKTEKKTRLQRSFDNETNWNYLFMNQNAVVEAVARKLNIPKSELMSKDNANLAVQQAAMETSIINETKEWLKENGFNIDALKGKRSECLRSKNTIFVKNISTTISKEKLEEYFSRYGQLVRFLISPSNTLAIAEFVNEKHAKNCIKKLAYFDIDGLPLYLEYAPESIIEKKDNSKANNLNKENNLNLNEDNNFKKNSENTNNQIDLVGNEGKILFITNLNFNTKENALKKFFTERGFEPAKVKIVTHLKDGKDKPVSSGFGFLEFENEEAPNKILRNFQGALLHGHSLKLSLAKSSDKSNKEENLLGQKRKAETELNDYDYEGEDIESTKLLIKNLA